MDRSKVLILGTSGVVGQNLLNMILGDDFISQVTVLNQYPGNITDSRVKEIIVDFDHLAEHENEFDVDCLFCCMGTNGKKNKSLPASEAAQFEITVKAAELAKKHNVPQIHVVSTITSDPNSIIFYNRLKGEMDQKIIKLNFESTFIYRPGLITGRTSKFCLKKSFAKLISPIVDSLLVGKLSKYKSIHPKVVACSMLSHFESKLKGTYILEANLI